MILGIRDTRLHHPRLVHFLIQPHFLDNGTYQAFTVRRIVNGKLRSEADIPGLDMQNAQEHGVKGSHPQMARPLRPHLTGYTLLHFARRLVGKGHRHNRVRRAVLHAQQPGDTVHQNARLTTARPCQNQHIGARGRYGFTLFVIKAVEQVRNVHWHRRKRRGSMNPC